MKKGMYTLLTLIALVVVTGCGKSEKAIEQPKCESITGGSYTLSFVTNSDATFEDKAICIACAPDSYEELPTFDGLEGWYYDSDFTKKVEATSTKDVTPNPIYDAKDATCVVGYRNITLYAKLN